MVRAAETVAAARAAMRAEVAMAVAAMEVAGAAAVRVVATVAARVAAARVAVVWAAAARGAVVWAAAARVAAATADPTPHQAHRVGEETAGMGEGRQACPRLSLLRTAACCRQMMSDQSRE